MSFLLGLVFQFICKRDILAICFQLRPAGGCPSGSMGWKRNNVKGWLGNEGAYCVRNVCVHIRVAANFTPPIFPILVIRGSFWRLKGIYVIKNERVINQRGLRVKEIAGNIFSLTVGKSEKRV